MQENKKQFYKTSERFHFSKSFKRMALIEYSKHKKPNDAMKACGFDVDILTPKDKKYAAKLLHKWRLELYENHSILSFMNCDLDDETLLKEIAILDDNTTADRIMEAIMKQHKT